MPKQRYCAWKTVKGKRWKNINPAAENEWWKKNMWLWLTIFFPLMIIALRYSDPIAPCGLMTGRWRPKPGLPMNGATDGLSGILRLWWSGFGRETMTILRWRGGRTGFMSPRPSGENSWTRFWRITILKNFLNTRKRKPENLFSTARWK